MVKRARQYVDSMENSVARWLADIRSTTRPRPHLKVDVSRCALLVIDMLRYFASPEGRAYQPVASCIIPVIDDLICLWRQHQGTLIFTRHCHKGPHDTGMLGTFFSDYIHCDEEQSLLIPELTPVPGELLLTKNTYDAFWQTDLQDYLLAREIKQVLITGVMTHMCCETTARSAFVRGFEVFLVADAMATMSERVHLGSLYNMANSCAVVLSRDEVRSACHDRRTVCRTEPC